MREKFRLRKTKKNGRKIHSKSQYSQAKILHKRKDQHVFNNCFNFCSRAINKSKFNPALKNQELGGQSNPYKQLVT